MNILYLAHRIPYPPNKGDKMRAFRHIEHLSRRHRVWCACFIDDPHDMRYLCDLRKCCPDVGVVEIKPLWSKLRGLASLAAGATVTEGFYCSRLMAALLKEWQTSVRFDAVLAFSSSMAAYALAIPARRRVLDLCDLDSLKWRDYADHRAATNQSRFRNKIVSRLYRIEGRRLSAAELRWIDGFDAAILATESEAAPLRTLVPRRKLHIVGNGITVPTPPGHAAASEQSAPRGPVVGFIGVMDYFPNVDAVTWFSKAIWPTIRRQFPTATFRIVGRSPTPQVRALASVRGVNVVGEVPDVSDALAGFDISVAPLRIARGVQNKVLEAMAAAKPVVLTTAAARGVAATPGRDYLSADTPQLFASAVCSLLSDQHLCSAIGESAQRFVAQHRRWDAELEKLELIITGMTERTSQDHDMPTRVHALSQMPSRSLTILHQS